jgi:hypothetical protein
MMIGMRSMRARMSYKKCAQLIPIYKLWVSRRWAKIYNAVEMCVHRSAEYLQRVILACKIPGCPRARGDLRRRPPRIFPTAPKFTLAQTPRSELYTQLAKHPHLYTLASRQHLCVLEITDRERDGNNWTLRRRAAVGTWLPQMLFAIRCNDTARRVLLYRSTSTNCCTHKEVHVACTLPLSSTHEISFSHRKSRAGASPSYNWLHPHLDTFYWSCLVVLIIIEH